MTGLIESAWEYGFRGCYLLPAEPFTEYKRRLADGAFHPNAGKLTGDVQQVYPWARAIVLLLWPYAPYRDGIPVASNYVPANAAYHATNRLMERMRMDDVCRMERVHLPVRELLLRSGIGIGLKSGLTAIESYGTRVAVQTCVTDACPAAFTPPKHGRPLCAHCHNCEQACPSGAITGEGLRHDRCIRAHMAADPMPDWVMANMSALFGCDLCQNACPYNQSLPRVDTMPDAFRLERLIRDDCADCLELIGVNQRKGGRLIAQAIVMCANLGRSDLLPLVTPYRDDERPIIRVAAEYAISCLQDQASHYTISLDHSLPR